jgi:hypothetical protein
METFWGSILKKNQRERERGRIHCMISKHRLEDGKTGFEQHKHVQNKFSY